MERDVWAVDGEVEADVGAKVTFRCRTVDVGCTRLQIIY